MPHITGNDLLQIAINNPDIDVPPDVVALAHSRNRNKFHAQRCEFDGMKFDSKAEMARYGELRYLEMSGHISALELQPVFLLPGGIRYKADFRYVEDGQTVVEDVKGGKATQTRTFINKWKQVQEQHTDIDFRLIER